MKKRFTYLLLFFTTVLLFFMLQKVIFMLYNGATDKHLSLTDYFDVIAHGASLDAATTGYLTALPWLAVLVSIWFKRFPLRGILTAYYVAIALVASLIFVGDMSLYPFWGFKLDASIFLYLDSPRNALASVSVGFILLRLLLLAVFAGIVAWLLCRITPRRLSATRRKITGTIATLLLGGVLFITIRGGVSESTSNIGQVYFSDNEFLNHSAVNPAFSLLASAGKTKDYAAQFDFFPEEERAALFDGLYPTGGENTVSLLNTTRPNILIILLEGFGATMVESLGGAPDASPNLDRLAQEGVWFTHCYANSFRTDRGTICALSGYQSFPDLSVMKIPAKSRTLPSIAGKLAEEGYATDFLYGGDINFTNMKSYLLESGYRSLTADTDFNLSQRKNPWGVNDDITFQHLYETIKARTGNQRWFTTFLTLSSHEPFEVPYHRLEEKKTNAFAFTDHCLGQFIDRLKQLPQWKDLLVICLPDHGFFYPDQGSPNDLRVHHIPMLWTGGAVKQPTVIDRLMNQTDLAATLLGQLDISHREFNFSRNVLGTEYTYPFAYYTYNNGFAFCDSTGFTLFDNSAGKTLTDHPVPSPDRLNRGKAILQTSYDDLGNR